MSLFKLNSRRSPILTYCRRLPYFKHISASSSSSDSSNESSIQTYDVIISGGGMVGTAMAAALGHDPSFSGKKVLLLEAGAGLPKTSDILPDQYSSRVCTLSSATKKLLSKFGAWKNIEDMRLQPVRRMQIWDSCSDSMISFNVPNHMSDLAYVVENDVILSAIVKQLELVKDIVEIRCQTKVQRYNFPHLKSASHGRKSSNLPHVLLNDGQTMQAKLLIGADGSNSLMRLKAGIFSVNWEYKQTAVVATVQISEDSDNNTAWQRFLPTGPIAFLPLSNKFSCLIWTTTPEHAAELLKSSPEKFVDLVNNAFWSDTSVNQVASYAGQMTERIISTLGFGERKIRQLPPTVLSFDLKSRMMFPLGLSHATNYVKPRMALIGDAAHRVHPLSGQGVNLGFGDVSCLSEVLAKAIFDGEEIGSLSHLMNYETERQRQVVPMMAVIDGLNRLYSNSFAPAVVLRSIGCQAADSLSPIKERMIQFAVN